MPKKVRGFNEGLEEIEQLYNEQMGILPEDVGNEEGPAENLDRC